MEFTVSGTRDGETEFSAPVEASSADEAEEKFLNSVEDPDEFDVEDVEPKAQP